MSQPFPDGFLWGVSTSAFQVEGALSADGRKPSIWDTYLASLGLLEQADRASGSYHHWQRDIECIRYLGAKAYRFSLAWPRILPEGIGPVNQAGLDHYSRMIDAMLAADIQPWVTLYHWDLPQVLEDRGGWQSRDVVDWFTEYASVVVEALGDRVKCWIPFNEIHAFVDQGYIGAGKAPNTQIGHEAGAQVYHHVLLAQGSAVAAMRSRYGDLTIGTAENPRAPVPIIETPENLVAARTAWDQDAGFLFEPIFHGKYPDVMTHWPRIAEGDMELIRFVPDFLGLNFYHGSVVEADDSPQGFRRIPYGPDHFRSAQETWINLLPEAAYWGVRWAHEVYAPPAIYVTENGFPSRFDAPPDQDHDDVTRIVFLRNYVSWLQRAAAEGAAIKGYFLWSLMDSFEWASGLSSRFGIFHTDFETFQRTPRLSADWYAQVIAANAVV